MSDFLAVLMTGLLVGAAATVACGLMWAAEKVQLGLILRQLVEDVRDAIDEWRLAMSDPELAELDELVVSLNDVAVRESTRREIRRINHRAGDRRPAA